MHYHFFASSDIFFNHAAVTKTVVTHTTKKHNSARAFIVHAKTCTRAFVAIESIAITNKTT